MAQDYPLECVELILVGDEARYRDWLADYGHGSRLHGAMAVPVPDGTLYYELKNLGAAQASGEIIAFVDSDVHPDPGWLSAIVRGISRGADVVSGVSAFWSRGRFRPPGPLLEAAASVCWGHTAARQPSSGEGSQPSGGLLAHNVAGRADVIRRIPFRTESGRNCGSSLFFADLKASGARIDFLPDQRVNHSFAPTWFLYPLHLRVGWEEHVTRRITQSRRSRVLRRLGPLRAAGRRADRHRRRPSSLAALFSRAGSSASGRCPAVSTRLCGLAGCAHGGNAGRVRGACDAAAVAGLGRSAVTTRDADL